MPQRPTTHSTKTLTPAEQDLVNSFLRKILPPSPLLPRLYEDYGPGSAPNSNQSNNLANTDPKISSHTNRTHMSNQPNVRSCTHIKVTGVRCASPAMRGEQFCYFHQRMIRGVRTPPQSRLHPIALIEDQESVQVALMEVINALMRNSIDLKRATLILRALHIAVRNVRYLKFGINDHKMVKDVPAYPAPPEPKLESVPAPAQWSANMTPAEVAAKIRADRAASQSPTPSAPAAPAAATTRVATASVGTGTPAPLGGPASPSRSALPSSADTSRPKPPASVKEEVKESAAPK